MTFHYLYIFINTILIYMNKIKRSFTLDDEIYNNFVLLSKHLSINKSQFIENRLKDFVETNKKTLKELLND